MMKVIRTIHPIGQGAFYSERFMDDGGKQIALVVYDCGSSDSVYLEKELSSYFNNGDVIDILFISHFHKDHINGIEKLRNIRVRINTVVVPIIVPQNKWFYIYVEGMDKDFIENPQVHTGAEKVIFIESIESGREQIIQGEQPQNIEHIDNNSIIHSGTEISSSKIPDWCYIPFNFDESTRLDILKTELGVNGINITRLNDATYINNHISTIRKSYAKVCKYGDENDRINNTSLIVFSGPYRDNASYLIKKWGPKSFWPFWIYRNAYNIKSGCLYLGDTGLNQTCTTTGKDILQDLEMYLSTYTKQVGTIQLPHHGAIGNFNNRLFSIFTNCRIFFASFGTFNTYGHPSYNVIEQIVYNGEYFCGVCESRGSGLIEDISI